MNHLRCIVLTLCVLWTLSCSTDQEQPEANVQQTTLLRHPVYDDWQTFQSGNIKIYYPTGHPQLNNFSSFSQGYSFALNRITTELELPSFTDTLHIYWYTGFGQGRAMTGQQYPFADSVIHFWLPSFPGPTVMQLLLPTWSTPPPRHKFLYHGLIALYDFSGQDYHWATVDYFNTGKLISLDSLAKDTTIDNNLERYQTAEAASFVAFVLAHYGNPILKSLYQSNLPFGDAVQEILGADIETIQTSWLQFARETARPPADSLSP